MSTLNGKCLCGEVRFTANPNEGAGICHCSMCRQWTGGMFIGVGLEAAPEFEDEAILGVYRSSDWAERVFCRNCGSSILFRTLDGVHQVVSVQCFDDPAQFPLESEIFIDEKPASYALTGQHQKMTSADFLAMVAPDKEG